MIEAIKQTIYLILMISGFTVIISFINGYTEAFIFSGLGNAGRILFSFIGTPIHEASHALMCLIFGHKIVDIKFFIPNPNSYVAGYVNHTYNPKSIYQNIGNFFIGLAPIFGGFFLVTLIYKNFMQSSKTWVFWTALFICSQIIIHMRCSKEDMLNSIAGLTTFTLLILTIGLFKPNSIIALNQMIFKSGLLIVFVSAINWLFFMFLYRFLNSRQ